MEKVCTACGTAKPLDAFYAAPKQPCKECHRERARNRYVHHPREYPPDGLKRCSSCKETKPISEFAKTSRNRDGLNYCCKTCSVAAVTASRKKNPTAHRRSSREWAAKNPRRVRDAYLIRTYGITHEQYREMLSAQGNACAICKVADTEKPLHVDHCHDTGKVRGLLCTSCNNGIGRFRHQLDFVMAAADYLTRTS